MDWHSTIGILAGIVGLLGFLPYIITTIQGKNTPNRASWWIWGILGVITGISYYYAGATTTIWVPVCYAVCQIITAILSLKYGEGGWNLLDKFCLAGAGTSLLLWWIFDSPLVALIFTLLIDLFAAIPTVIKSYSHPEQESCFSWTIFLIANTLNMIALEEWSISLVAYPFYLFYLSSTLSIILWLPRITGKSKSYRRKQSDIGIEYNENF
ncbi:MAG: hypothetical protein AAGE96_07670 [Cyanobacteria bacterium P01_G01_bin.19]